MTPEISVVIPLYNEAACLEELARRIQKTLDPMKIDYEVIFVDDASKDSSWDIILKWHAANLKFKGIRLRRNAGHQIAYFAGICHSSGKGIITMDADLQHPPEEIPQFMESWKNGYDLVYGFKTAQAGRSPLKKGLNRFFHGLFTFLTGVNLHPETSDFQLMDRSLTERLIATWQPHFFLRGWIHRSASKKNSIGFKADLRYRGHTKHSLARLAKLGFSALFLFPRRSHKVLIRLPGTFIPFYEIESTAGLDAR